jgi:hypothetical protein
MITTMITSMGTTATIRCRVIPEKEPVIATRRIAFRPTKKNPPQWRVFRHRVSNRKRTFHVESC